MTRRLTTFVLAAFYLLQATWLLHAGVDLLLPKVREAVATVVDSCCTNACGCPEEVRLAQGCCCMKSDVVQPPAKKNRPVSAIEEARCKGLQDAMSQALTQPVVCGFASFLAPSVESSPTSIPDVHPFFPPSGDAADKVPIL